MENASAFCIVMVTVPDVDLAREIVRGALKARLAACGNILRGVESHYWWQGKLEQATEVLILFKTMNSAVQQLEAHITAAHPYETPEIITIDLTTGTPKYLDWIVQSQT
ncbi:MAG: cutA [Verrucomicrobiales bacterium]|jgi:periplasmic divalent cation tolerance protein|nr:cutA [Verrucomicrobiales bacterium]